MTPILGQDASKIRGGSHTKKILGQKVKLCVRFWLGRGVPMCARMWAKHGLQCIEKWQM